MKKEETQLRLSDESIFKLLLKMSKKYPNDADLGGVIRKMLIEIKQQS